MSDRASNEATIRWLLYRPPTPATYLGRAGLHRRRASNLQESIGNVGEMLFQKVLFSYFYNTFCLRKHICATTKVEARGQRLAMLSAGEETR
jgi:hypothetical protein